MTILNEKEVETALDRDEMDCTCGDWEDGIKQIIAQQMFCHFQSVGPKCTAPAFRFCPWCGHPLKISTGYHKEYDSTDERQPVNAYPQHYNLKAETALDRDETLDRLDVNMEELR